MWISTVPFSGAHLVKTHRWRPAVQGDSEDGDGRAAQQASNILLLLLSHTKNRLVPDCFEAQCGAGTVLVWGWFWSWWLWCMPTWLIIYFLWSLIRKQGPECEWGKELCTHTHTYIRVRLCVCTCVCKIFLEFNCFIFVFVFSSVGCSYNHILLILHIIKEVYRRFHVMLWVVHNQHHVILVPVVVKTIIIVDFSPSIKMKITQQWLDHWFPTHLGHKIMESC